MDITYLGHSSFRLKGKTASVVIDPFDSKAVGLPFPKVSAEIVTISHDHEDHNKAELVKDVRKVISGPGEYEINGVSIVGIASYHDDTKGTKRGKNTIYMIEMDGLRIVHLGDLGHKLSEKFIEKVGSVDVLIVPVGGEYTIGAVRATELTRLIEPSIIIPMHFKVPNLNPATFSKLAPVEPFLTQIGLPVEKLKKLTITNRAPEEEQKVVLLETKQ
ncbi:MBL fold metallo-hydrolase [Patescibacteria group bacterium]|nr:MBL fold metallo-hydrolase [Patescibacteria group bacterium]MBU0777140.1 MBL fold metallo-hydrolase [Patescibacteria group bacterium]MBU0845834.1 MBL fold metallo-hydrolase [Patescibacteria group bacterium]MBU0922861.1 MBL fold metallo-hydrolase [Patescibacteria group bacterium]MBU1066406.1 MBL fold metallo-hydrolase [Patescibacteria group bacterium]